MPHEYGPNEWTCHACKEKITDRVMVHEGYLYHPECNPTLKADPEPMRGRGAP